MLFHVPSIAALAFVLVASPSLAALRHDSTCGPCTVDASSALPTCADAAFVCNSKSKCVPQASLGQKCDGLNYCAPACHPALTCFHKNPTFLTGVCVPVAGCGGACGGTTDPLAPVCGPTLTCNNGNNPTQPGTCVQLAGFNETCGGFLACAPVCQAPYRCMLPLVPDLPGTCLYNVY
ncbi:Aste57867_21332 [Aphanomyces stellatus]|uniref:Aste57867_21332 protein n=1 Tax=Aphanomyces stellatus TaxID=120398 RepID=A0A485LJB7_9STRA|nr:hypothetical protein As57867_021263 [Aphanomyces stellatus]VFT98004.1 Aste57867_21332 [Aphanomyces stellatus]